MASPTGFEHASGGTAEIICGSSPSVPVPLDSSPGTGLGGLKANRPNPPYSGPQRYLRFLALFRIGGLDCRGRSERPS
jgi:hypothetical protein